MKLPKQEMNYWVAGYIEAQENWTEKSRSCKLHWAINKFFEYEIDHPEFCWEAILEILRREPSKKVLCMLAAGPLEDLIHSHGPEFIEKIEEEARVNREFKLLLRGVWESSTEEIWNRVLRARK